MENENNENINSENISTVNNAYTKLDSVSALFKKTWVIYKDRVWVLAGVNMIGVLAMAVILVIPLVISMIISFSTGFWALAFPVVMMFAIIAIVLISVLMKAGVLIAIRDGNEKIGPIEALKRSKKYIWRYFAIGIASLIIGFGSTIFLIVPAIIMTIFLSLSTYVLVSENTNVQQSLVKSFDYIRNHWWVVFGRMLLMFIIIMILDWLFSWIPVLNTVILMFFVVPYMFVFMFELYKNLKQISDTSNVVPKKSTKNLIMSFAILGIIVIILMIVFVLPKANTAIKNSFSQQEQSQIY